MQSIIKFQPEAEIALFNLQKTDPKKHKKVLKTLAFMECNLRHPSLNTHKFKSFPGYEKQEVFESYVENKTPGAFRVFWVYGEGKGVITVIAITLHP